VRVRVADGLRPTQARVVIESTGQRLEAEADTGMPAIDLDVQRTGLLHQFNMLASPVLGAAGAQRLADAALRVDEIESVAGLLRLARPG